MLAQRKLAYEELDLSLSKYDQSKLLPLLKEERHALVHIHSQVLQNVGDRLDKAFEGFFRRCKAGENPGFPRLGEGTITKLISFYSEKAFIYENKDKR